MDRKIGWGSLSLPLFIIGIIFPITFWRTICLGEIIFKLLGIPTIITKETFSSSSTAGSYATSAVTSYFNTPIIGAAVLLLTGLIIGFVFRKNRYAKVGRILCLTIFILYSIGILPSISFYI